MYNDVKTKCIKSHGRHLLPTRHHLGFQRRLQGPDIHMMGEQDGFQIVVATVRSVFHPNSGVRLGILQVGALEIKQNV